MTNVSRKCLSLLILIAAALPLAAQSTKRHAVAPSIAMVVLRGTVTDSGTGAPVLFAQVANGPRTAVTSADGSYAIFVPVGLTTAVVAGRSGYEPSSTTIVGKDGLVVNFSLKGKPTVRVRLTNGSSYDVDAETAQFAQELLFTSPSRSDNINLCKADGTKFNADRSEFARITGPAVSVMDAACCTATPVLKVTVDLKNGEHHDVVLADSCTGVYIDFAGRNHLTGQFVYTRFEDIQEIVFP